MTPFMFRIAEVIGASESELADVDEVAPMPQTRVSQRIATGTGADRQVALRAYAEQLICEANAVLTTHHETGDKTLSLFDETLPSELAFNVGYSGRAARVSTTFENGTAVGRLVGDGFESEIPQELEGPDALPDLIVRLLVAA